MARLPVRLNLMTPHELSHIEKSRARLEDQLTKRIELDVKNSASPNNDEVTKTYLQRLQAKRKQISSALQEDLVIGKLKRDVQRAMRIIYLQLIKAGKDGIDADDLREKNHLENLVLIEAIKKLEKLNKVEWLDDGRLTTLESLKQYPGKAYNVYVEKILPGKALVLVDEKWHARLNQYDYDGPRALLRTGSEFKAIGDLYRDRGILNLRIRQIIYANN
jgi:hypothetical protein